jgi:histidinol phosphatase-like PHP family hydrolase
VDTNSTIAALLRDFAAVQASTQSRWGYKRAAAAIRDLPQPIERYVQPDGTLRKIPNVGPASTRVILEVLRTGRSATVDAAVAASGSARSVEKSRALRVNFLSRAQVSEALERRAAGVVTLRDYRGDLQMHSTWSDGGQSLADIVKGGIARGYEYNAVTDHSYGLPIAKGLSMERIVAQLAAIDRLNKTYAGRFRLLKGIEANIRADGTLDMSPDEIRQLEIVVAAPHSALRIADDQTDRMIRIVRTRGVHILGHPRGRMYGSRAGVVADWPKVFRAAAASKVAIEIDGDPSRQDVDFELAKIALKAGCLFALDSDAHGTAELAYAETAVAHARLAGVPAKHVINCWPLKRLLAWAHRRRESATQTT